MSDTTTAILNETLSVESRIDTVLGSVDRELDWSNDSGWQPGDPLYERRSPFAGGQFWVLPTVANPSAPTLAELASAMAVRTGLQLDDYQRAFIDAWFSGPSPVGTQTAPARPSPLPIDGHAYRRRTKRRRRR